MQNAPALLRSIGISIDDIPDVNQSGDLDLEDLVAYLVEERLRQQQATDSRVIVEGVQASGHAPQILLTAARTAVNWKCTQ